MIRILKRSLKKMFNIISFIKTYGILRIGK